jgi:hypothetical protein
MHGESGTDSIDVASAVRIVSDVLQARPFHKEPACTAVRCICMKRDNQKGQPASDFCSEQIFHRREWFVQRSAWVVMTAVIAAAIAGVFGGGPLANARVAIGDGHMEYERFVRKRADTEWRIKPAHHTAAGRFRVSIDTSLLEHYEVTSIVPEPQATQLAFGQAVFEFDLGSNPADIVFHLEPEQVGPSSGEVRFGNSKPAQIQQFIYP